MSEITDRQNAATDIDPITAPQANDTNAAAIVEGAIDVARLEAPSADAAAAGLADPAEVGVAGSVHADEMPTADAGMEPDTTGPVGEPETLLYPALTDATHAVYADTIVEVEDTADDAPLLDDDLEHGIASVFAALHAAAQDRDMPDEPSDGPEAADIVTFRLLGELDRLWHRAA